MSDTCETVRVVASDPEQGDFVVINAADFDASVHSLFEGDDTAEPADFADMTVVQLKAMAEERGVDLGDATKKADIIAALELAAE